MKLIKSIFLFGVLVVLMTKTLFLGAGSISTPTYKFVDKPYNRNSLYPNLLWAPRLRVFLIDLKEETDKTRYKTSVISYGQPAYATVYRDGKIVPISKRETMYLNPKEIKRTKLVEEAINDLDKYIYSKGFVLNSNRHKQELKKYGETLNYKDGALLKYYNKGIEQKKRQDRLEKIKEKQFNNNNPF